MSWRLLTVTVPPSLDDEIASVLGSGSLGVEIVPAGAGTSTIRVYLGQADDLEAWRSRAARILGAHDLTEADAQLSIAEVADEGWVERWQRALAPIPLGSRFVVLPHEGLEAPEGREPIRLIPGMAFGTGEHPTTRLCAAALEDLVTSGSSWLDLGCGTGILAIVAARLGAGRVLALDLDPQAAQVAAEVVRANGLTDGIEVGAGSLDRAIGPFDGIVANIQSSFFLSEATGVAAVLVPRGVLAISGILVEDLEEIEHGLSRAGIETLERRSDGPWACLLGRRS
jgi:ribosomal protein L11 methyltransferase